MNRLNYQFTVRTVLSALLICGTLFVGTSFSQPTKGPWKAVKSLAKKKGDGRKKILVKVDKSSKEKIVLDYSFPDVELSKVGESLNKEVVQLTLGNAKITGKEGEPILPVVPTQVLIPEGYSIKRIFAKVGNRNVMKGTYSVPHHEGFFPISNKKKGKRVKKDAKIYNSDSNFPMKRCELVTVQKKHGASIATINLHPVIYRPKSGALIHFSTMQLHVVLQKDGAQYRTSSLGVKKSRLTAEDLAVENPEVLETYSEGVAESSSQLNASVDAAQYVIITNSAVKDATTDYTVQDLIALRQSRGMTATIKTTEEIYADYAGTDNAEKVRNFIIDAYTNWNTEYVVLAGDINIIPMRKLTAEGEQIPSDLYYQCLDGSMNSDNDGYWGESNDGEGGGDIDLAPEVYVGRISGENPDEIANHIYKIIAYENENENAAYLRNALIAGEHLGSNFGPDVFGYGRSYMSHIIEGSTSGGYTTAGFNSSPLITVDTIYDFTQTWSKNDIISLINSNTFSMINHLGHANDDYVMKFYNSDADGLSNSKFLFLNSQGCIPGNFETDCIAEHLTTSTRTGLYACILNARYGWGAFNDSYETLDGPSQRFQREFWDAYFDENIMHLGRVNADSHEDNIWDINGTHIRWCYYETNLFGDPATIMKGKSTEALLAFSAVVIDDQLGDGNNIINPGEEIALTVSLANLGLEDALGVSASLTTANSAVTITDADAAFDLVSGGTNKTALDEMRIVIAPDCATPQEILFDLTITDANSKSWTSQFTLDVYTSSSISGLVSTFTDNNSVDGAQVFYSGPFSGMVETDVDGYYTIDVIDGEYSVYASADEYLISDTQVVTLPPHASDIDFFLKRPLIALNTKEVSDSLGVGGSSTVAVKLYNKGDTELTYTIDLNDVTSDSFSLASFVYGEEFHKTLPKGAFDTRVGRPVSLGKGGPDEFGYKWIDSDEVGGPRYEWNDITASGTLLGGVSNMDDYSEAVALGFSFPYYGVDFDTMYVGSNGYVTFGRGASQYSNSPIPSVSNPSNMVAAFFDDLRTQEVYILRTPDSVTIQYEEATPYSGSGTYTFQIVITSSGEITFYYKDMNGSVSGASVGIQNSTGDDGVGIAYNTPYIKDSMAVRLRQGPEWIQVTPESGTVPVGGEVTLTLALNASELEEGTYRQNVSISHNDPTVDTAEVISVELTVKNDPQLPVVTDQPLALTVYEGDTADFSITATGSDLEYLWQKRGLDLASETATALAYAPAELADDQAEFRCIVTNALGADTSLAALLTVLPRFSVEFDSTLTSDFTSVSVSDSTVDTISLDTTVTTIRTVREFERLVIQTDSLDRGVIFYTGYDTTETVIGVFVDTTISVLPYIPTITVEYDTTQSVTVDTLLDAHVDISVDTISLDTTIISIDSTVTTTETIIQTDSLNNGVVYYTGYDTTLTELRELLRIDTVVRPYIPVITVEYDTTQNVSVDTISEVNSSVDSVSLDTTIITIDSSVTTTETIIQTDSLDHGVVFYTGYDTTLTELRELLRIDTVVRPYIPVITVEYDTTQNVTVDTIREVNSSVDSVSLDTTIITIDSSVTYIETIIQTDSLDHGVVYYTGYDTTFTELRELLRVDTVIRPYIPVITVEYDTTQSEMLDTITSVDSVVDATTLDTAVTTIDTLIRSIETIIRTDSLDHGVIFATHYDTTQSEIREELQRNIVILPYINDEYELWDANQPWYDYTVGDLRSNDGKLWKCINKAFAYLEPSSPWGHHGWTYVKDL